MKHLVLIIFMLSSIVAFSQSRIQPHKTELYLKLIDNLEHVVPFFKIYLKDSDDSKIQYAVTDSKGNCNFKAITGNSYKVYIADTHYVSTINIPVNAMSYYTQKVVLPELTDSQLSNKVIIDTIDQYRLNVSRPDPGNIFFKIGLKNHMNQAVKNMEVRIFNSKTKTAYLSKTNQYGEAKFHVPGKSLYVVGINNFERFDSVTVPHHSYGLILSYIPTKVKEYENNDTITQAADAYMRATTDRTLLKVYLRDHDNQALSDEEVFLDVIGNNKVYYGKTGKDGVLTMLLPKGLQYELNFKYERAMKRIDNPLTPTLYTSKFYMTYMGSKKIEEFYAQANSTDGLRTEFLEPKIKVASFDKGVYEKTDQGYNFNFSDEGVILTPAVYNDKLFVSSGYYSPNIYCVDASTGKPEWGVKLAESGPSVLVVSDGMLLVNTQSCTLYAIDIETGILAWSKWLGPNIYHSPAVINGQVICSYPNDLSYTSNNFVLAAFNIQTGEIVWQNLLKSEPIGAPVCSSDKIFISDSKGYLYSLNASDGKNKIEMMVHATCPPVFDGEDILVNTILKDNPKKSGLRLFMPSDFSQSSALNLFTDSCDFVFNHNWSSSLKMSYSRNRVLIKNGVNYQINTKGLQAFSKAQEIFWTFPISTSMQFNPVLAHAGKFLLASTNNSKLALVNPANGKKVLEYTIPDIIFGEPVIANGWIYCGTKNGKLVAINTKDKAITGWYQWGLDASHNPWIK